MTVEEFREAYLQAQNGLGNDLQALIGLSRDLEELTSSVNELIETTQANYMRMNEVVEQFFNEQEQP